MKTSAYYHLPADLAADIDTYQREVQAYLDGDLPGDVFKAKRVPRGVYEQRRDGTFMVRVRVAGGTLNAAQVAELAELSRVHGNDRLHVTTRQDVQFHDVAIEDTPTIMRRLLSVGLTSKGGGGNTVRNIMACPYAGICSAEVFDVTPCAHAVTEYLIGLKGSYNLPRKYKIAFSGCAGDCALAQVSDLGFIAAMNHGRPGFRVVAGGGMGAHSRVGERLLDWVPASEILRVAEAVRRMFDRLGDRSNRHRARLRFVLERLGISAFREAFQTAMQTVVADGVPEWQLACAESITDKADPEVAARPPAPETRDGVRVIPQRQAGMVSVPLHLPMGFLSSADFSQIGELAGRFSRELGLRATREQNLLIRFVAAEEVSALADGLHALTADVLSPVPLDRFVACAGASTCRLGFCLARKAARACADGLAEANTDRATLDGMDVHINGCANSCGQQPIGAIGLFGMAQRVGGHLAPTYAVTLGGRCNAAGARFGTPAGMVPAAALPALMRELASDFAMHRSPGETFTEVVDRLGIPHFETLVARHATIPAMADAPEYYRDLGSDETFSLAGRGAGECGAGVFEVIRQDLDAAKKANTLFDALLSTTRALLITRGVDARDPDSVLRAFETHFVETGLVPTSHRPLLTRARGFIEGWERALNDQSDAIAGLHAEVEHLFSTLDANLEFHVGDVQTAADGNAAGTSTTSHADRAGVHVTEPDRQIDDSSHAELDLRGVACPMNFVKVKLRLEVLASGDTLAVVLDDGEPIRNVPASLAGEGHAIEETQSLGDGRWRIVVRKKTEDGDTA